MKGRSDVLFTMSTPDIAPLSNFSFLYLYTISRGAQGEALMYMYSDCIASEAVIP